MSTVYNKNGIIAPFLCESNNNRPGYYSGGNTASWKSHKPVSKTHRPENSICGLKMTYSFLFFISYISNALIDREKGSLLQEKLL